MLVRLRGYYTSAASTVTGGSYVPVRPVTVVNNVAVAAGGTTTFTATGAHGIPASANVKAIALNVIANQPAAAGYLQAYPAGPRPAGNSTLNYQQGRTTANFEAVPVSASGQVSIFSTAATKVLVRLRGYYTKTETPRGADWSQYRDGPAHLGTNALETVLTPSTVRGLGQAWTATINGNASEPAVVGGVVYVGSSDRKVYALNAATGATVWTATTGGEVRSSPAVVGGVVYVGSSDRKVYALNAATGATVWTATTGGLVLDSPAVTGGVVYVRSRDGRAYALDAGSGATVWITSIGGNPTFGFPPAVSSPAVADGMVYVAGLYDGRLYALNAASGATVWTATAGYTVVGSPAVADGTVYAVLGTGVGSNVLRALNAATGSTVWAISGGPVTSVSSVSPVVANGVLYTATLSGVLVARNANTGAILWTDFTTIGRSTRSYFSVVVANGAVYARRESGVSAHHP